jgi:hypothetical protein
MAIADGAYESRYFTKIDPADDISIAKCTEIIAESFLATPLCVAIIADVDQLLPSTPHDVIDVKRSTLHFADKIQRLARDGAVMVQSGDWSAVAIWEPPNFRMVGEPANRNCALIEEWKELVKIIEAEHLGVQSTENGTSEVDQSNNESSKSEEPKSNPHWHLGFLARNPSVPTVPGAISALLRPFLDRAVADGVPAWLEATTPRAVSIYEHFGFRVVEKVTLGTGRFCEDGWPEIGGPGVNAWVMIFDQHLKSPG